MDVLHCELLLRLPAANIKNLFCDSSVHVLCVAKWWPAGMLVHCVTSPFYGKQKFVHCSVCEVRIHCVCLQLEEAEQAAITAMGESVYKCNACAKLLGSSGNDKAPAKSLEL
jgi:hypothetical protein